MKAAVLSGKGGAGKTFVSVNLAAAAQNAVYADCDVEEPNGRIFLKPEGITQEEVCTKRPVFDETKCTGCRKCVDFCRFNALVYLKKKPKLFEEICHACGGCALVCPEDAVSETDHRVGIVEQGMSGGIQVITGVLDEGESSGIPVIEAVLQRAQQAHRALTVIDCPPGSACPVMESVRSADLCLLVAEPTAFGFHNFCMVHELVTLLGKPCGVIINKEDTPYEPLERFCAQHGTPVLMHIPYSSKTAQQCAEGRLMCREDEKTADAFRQLLAKLESGVLA